MRKQILFTAALLALCFSAAAQVSVTATSITDSLRNKVTGRVCFTPVNAANVPTGFRVGAVQVDPTEACSPVLSGAVGTTVEPTPAGIYYHVVVRQPYTPVVLRDFGLTQITGTSWSFDSFDPNLAILPVSAITAGPTTTLPPGSPASCTITGKGAPYQLSCGVPQGAQGLQGIQGPQGVPGAAVPTNSSGVATSFTVGRNPDGSVVPGAVLAGANTNGVLNAAVFPGVDIGAQTNAAIAQLAGACGSISIPAGAYSFATQIVKPRCVRLAGNSAVLTWTGAATTPALVTGSVAGVDYTQGEVADLKLVSATAGQGVGLWLGGQGTASSYNVPAGLSDYLETFRNVNVSGFAAGWGLGDKIYQDTWVSSSATGNTEGMQVMSGFGSENMNLHGFQCLNNTDRCFFATDLGGAQYNFVTSSFDYNGNGAFWYVNGIVRINGGHFEGGNTTPFVDGPASGAAFSMVLAGGVQFVSAASSLASYIRVPGTNSSLFVYPGVSVNHSGKVSELVDWEAGGQSSQLNIAPYADPLATNSVTMPAVSIGAGLSIAYANYPVYTQYVPTDYHQSTMSITNPTIGAADGSGYVGTHNNLNGTLPPLPGATGAPLGYNGNYLAWNAAGKGDADLFNPYAAPLNQDPAFPWYVYDSVSNAWFQEGYVRRDGWLWMYNGFSTRAGDGLNKTVVIGGCSIVFTGGIATSTSGC